MDWGYLVWNQKRTARVWFTSCRRLHVKSFKLKTNSTLVSKSYLWTSYLIIHLFTVINLCSIKPVLYQRWLTCKIQDLCRIYWVGLLLWVVINREGENTKFKTLKWLQQSLLVKKHTLKLFTLHDILPSLLSRPIIYQSKLSGVRARPRVFLSYASHPASSTARAESDYHLSQPIGLFHLLSTSTQ